jgi:hypothetical protein
MQQLHTAAHRAGAMRAWRKHDCHLHSAHLGPRSASTLRLVQLRIPMCAHENKPLPGLSLISLAQLAQAAARARSIVDHPQTTRLRPLLEAASQLIAAARCNESEEQLLRAAALHDAIVVLIGEAD